MADAHGSPLKALGDSNYAKGGADTGAPDGDVGTLGYVKKPYVSAGPALDNTKIANLKDSIGSLGNDGTNRGAYSIQPETVSAENPEPGKQGTGNTGSRAS